jgi:3-oxoadipate enol-lactonase
MSSQRVVLVHAGICDNRMWDGFAPLLGEREVVRHERRGYGDTAMPAGGSFSYGADLEAALDGPAVLVGASFGGFLCLDVAARRPELVAGLVLLDAPLFDHDFSDEMEAYGAEEERLLEAGDLDGVTELNVEFWEGGADAEVRDAVRTMQRRALDLQHGSEAEPQMPESIDLTRIEAPALVVTGERDRQDFQEIARRLVAGLPDATAATVPGAYHLPALERPEETARLVLEFLAR